MKPRNFPQRKLRRQARAYRRRFVEQPCGFVEQPTDIRIRLGKGKRG
jgi:hypothetical protein